MSKQTNILPDNPQIEVIKSGCTGLFTNYIYKAIPLAFDESMSYYETLCGLLHYLKNIIIPTVNNNADAVAELQTLYEELRSYVDDYFKGLDVQEEINNKLDKMAESGQLADIIAQYLKIASMLSFDTVDDLKNSENVVNGSICRTLGFDNINDEMGSYYKIRTIKTTDEIDGFNIIKIETSDTLVAEKISNPVKINEVKFENKVYPTLMSFDSAYYGFNKSQGDENPQVAFISEHKPHENNVFSHNPYGMYVETTAKGSGTTIANKGTQIGLLVNSLMDSEYINGNVNTPDYKGSIIGIAGFAQGKTSGDNTVVCGLWGYPTTPKLTQEQYDSISQKTSTFGLEINIEMLQPNNEFNNYVIPGSVVGIFINNYKEPSVSQERQIYDFGIALNGSPLDGNYSSVGIDKYHAYHVGILIDKIENKGISFGEFIKNDATLISIPHQFSFTGQNHPNITGLDLGDTRMNFGRYLGSTFNNGDMWRNDNILFYYENDQPHEIIMTNKPINRPLVLGQEIGGIYPNNSMWVYENNLYFKDNSGNTHTIAFV